MCIDIERHLLIFPHSGGAMASFALHSDDPSADPEQGGHVMLGGIIYQFVCLIVYCGFMLEYLCRKYENWPCKRRWNNGTAVMRDHDREITKRRLQIVMLALTSALLMVRSSYRVAELADGFAGELIQTEWALDALDGGMIAACMFIVNFLHPGYLQAKTQNDNWGYVKQYY